jgi:hypothetical protein
MSTQLEREFADESEKLAPEERAQVLQYMRALKDEGVPGATLLKYVGRIPPEDLRCMAAAIEEDFERVHGTA